MLEGRVEELHTRIGHGRKRGAFVTGTGCSSAKLGPGYVSVLLASTVPESLLRADISATHPAFCLWLLELRPSHQAFPLPVEWTYIENLLPVNTYRQQPTGLLNPHNAHISAIRLALRRIRRLCQRKHAKLNAI